VKGRGFVHVGRGAYCGGKNHPTLVALLDGGGGKAQIGGLGVTKAAQLPKKHYPTGTLKHVRVDEGNQLFSGRSMRTSPP